ncbi:MAG: sel1 repeat family protein [Opitutales bacterium]|nr:sel1 repeat family protein [Opitutales bacterium]
MHLLAIRYRNYSKYDKSEKYYKLAASMGNPDAQFELAQLYTMADKFGNYPEKSFRYLFDAAEWGIPQARYLLARYYENGKGVERDVKQALRWFKEAA